MNKLSCILGIDIGTTSVKVVAFEESGGVLAQSEAHLDLIAKQELEAEQEPYDVYNRITDVMVKVLKRIRQDDYVVRLVGFSAAMHSLIPISAENEPLGNALTWLDGRAANEANEIWASQRGRQLYRETGTPIHAMSPMVKLVWLRRTQPELFRQAKRFVSLKEWVWYRWFGVWEVDESMASASGLYDLVNRQWDRSALEYVQIKPHQLSQLVPTTFFRQGCTETRLLEAGITSETLFNIGASDGVLANLGIGAVEKGTLALTMGTSLAVRMFSDVAQTHEEIRSFCYVLDENHFVMGAPSNSGGIVLGWVYQNFLKDEPSIESAVEKVKDLEIERLYCLPYISGERAPIWNSDARASFIGLGLQHTHLHILRAAIEGILFNAYWIASELFTQVEAPDSIIVSGKLFEVPWVGQLVADIFNLPVQVNSIADAAIQGAVQLAGMSTQSIEENEEKFFPADSHKYRLKFNEFRALASHLNPY